MLVLKEQFRLGHRKNYAVCIEIPTDETATSARFANHCSILAPSISLTPWPTLACSIPSQPTRKIDIPQSSTISLRTNRADVRRENDLPQILSRHIPNMTRTTITSERETENQGGKMTTIESSRLLRKHRHRQFPGGMTYASMLIRRGFGIWINGVS